MVAVLAAIDRRALQQTILDVIVTGNGRERDQPVFVGHDAVQRHARLEMPGPAHESGHTVRTFPVRVLLAAKRCRAGIGPRVVVRTVVGRVHQDRVVRHTEFVEQLQEAADVLVVLDHAVAVLVLTGLAAVLSLDVRAKVHAGRVPPHEPRLAGGMLLADEGKRPVGGFIIDRFHPLLGQRTGVLDALATLAVRPGMQHAAGAEFLTERRILRVVEVLRLFLRIQVIEVAEEFIKAVHRRQVLVAVALMVLAELAGGVALALEDRGHRHVGLLPALGGTGQADLRHATANRYRAADEGCAAGRAALLRVIVGEADAFPRDPVNVRCLVAHHAAVGEADVPGADVITPEHQDVRLRLRECRAGGGQQQQRSERPAEFRKYAINHKVISPFIIL